MNVTINVTQDDIDNGCRGNAIACPVARAAARVLDASHMSVRTKVLEFVDPLILILLPPAVVEFIRRFDSRVRVQPFSFSLDIPDNLAKATP
jgi:hypothetical protein